MPVSLSDVPHHADNSTPATTLKVKGMAALIQRIVDVAERLFVILLAIPFLWAFARVLPTHPNMILTAISEMLAVLLILIRRPGWISVNPIAVLVAFCGTAFPLLVRPGGDQLVPTIVSSALMIGGLGLSVISKLYLNRSFGMIAANRGVKIGGPYRMVRHPMYLGYIINQLGFILASFTALNLAIYLFAWAFQLLRIREEESVLCKEADYRRFASRVTSRLVPGVY